MKHTLLKFKVELLKAHNPALRGCGSSAETFDPLLPPYQFMCADFCKMKDRQCTPMVCLLIF